MMGNLYNICIGLTIGIIAGFIAAGVSKVFGGRIDLGPDGGGKGGQVVYAGTPEGRYE